MDSSKKHDKIVKTWQKIPTHYSETNLELNFVQPMLLSLGLDINQIQASCNLGTGTGLNPDRLIYKDLNQPPVLVIETKKRISSLAKAASEQDFIDLCHQPNSLYREAVGYSDKANNNGIRQYLDKSNSKIQPNRLASYGLVFNGDFFQLWRRVEGLVLPLTPIQRVTATSIPKLMQQLEYCLNSPPRALVTAIWNRKGGVAKTTNTLNLGSVLALKNKKVLLIDLDTQNDLTIALRINPKNHADYLELCLTKIQSNKVYDVKEILQKNIRSCTFPTTTKSSFSLDILPGEQNTLEKIRDDAKNYGTREKVKLFQKLVDILTPGYDYIFIDVSPAGDDLTRSTLYCCDTLLIPSDYSKKTLRHAVDLYQKDAIKVRELREKQSKLHVGPWNLGLVFSNCPPGVTPNSRLETYIQAELKNKRFTGKQCKTRLAIYAQTKLAEYQHRPVVCWQKSQITKLYSELADEIFFEHHFLDD